MTNMNKHEEDELVNALRRRGDHQVWATTLSCTVAEYRSAARRVMRQQGWRIRTFLIGDGSVTLGGRRVPVSRHGCDGVRPTVRRGAQRDSAREPPVNQS